jgi:hypothetical protein
MSKNVRSHSSLFSRKSMRSVARDRRQLHCEGSFLFVDERDDRSSFCLYSQVCRD